MDHEVEKLEWKYVEPGKYGSVLIAHRGKVAFVIRQVLPNTYRGGYFKLIISDSGELMKAPKNEYIDIHEATADAEAYKESKREL